MSLASRAAPAVVALACAGPCAAVDASGYLRPEYIEQTATGRGPLAAANGLVPGIVSLPRSGPEIDAELRATADGVKLTITFDAMHDDLWTERARAGHESQMRKLDALLAAQGKAVRS